MSLSLDRLRVLIVEDEALVSLMLETMLGRLGAEVVGTASSLEDGLELVGQVPIDAAILDVNLSGERSFPIADRLRSLDVPFLFASGYGSSVLPTCYADAEMVRKPYRAEDIARALRRVTASR